MPVPGALQPGGLGGSQRRSPAPQTQPPQAVDALCPSPVLQAGGLPVARALGPTRRRHASACACSRIDLGMLRRLSPATLRRHSRCWPARSCTGRRGQSATPWRRTPLHPAWHCSSSPAPPKLWSGCRSPQTGAAEQTVGALLQDTSLRSRRRRQQSAGKRRRARATCAADDRAGVGVGSRGLQSLLPSRLADETLTWIALGGTGNTDPTFDPLTCTGHPGDTTVNVWTWYRQAAIETGEGAEMHPLWRVRSAITSSWPRIPGRVLMTLAVDPQPEVRLSVSRFKELTFRTAETPRKRRRSTGRSGRRSRTQAEAKGKPFVRRYFFRRGILLPLVLVGLWLPPLLSSKSDPSGTPPPSASQVTEYWNLASRSRPIGT